LRDVDALPNGEIRNFRFDGLQSCQTRIGVVPVTRSVMLWHRPAEHPQILDLMEVRLHRSDDFPVEKLGSLGKRCRNTWKVGRTSEKWKNPLESEKLFNRVAGTDDKPT
jgi:hypothetical protein